MKLCIKYPGKMRHSVKMLRQQSGSMGNRSMVFGGGGFGMVIRHYADDALFSRDRESICIIGKVLYKGECMHKQPSEV